MANEKDIKNKAEELDDEALEEAVGGVGAPSSLKYTEPVDKHYQSGVQQPSTGKVTIPVQPGRTGRATR